ncbi:hypothetical protein SAMN04515620_11331 [Collimonas sp. OK607]|uniref:hypothetical protein n=1 Tax=Collimonas sp. OK607 TaxID=1798194 RepID=UPI0008E7DD53|nr:hypothetical protein [Collimonas sp. OK607]SFB02581.1 hypothetical protein SAMN04515620_11331 [Collimonas sp. OK607]
MTILFAGGEDADFNRLGGVSVDTVTSAARRPANARCSLKVASSARGDGWQAVLSVPSSSFWLTAQGYILDTLNTVSASASQLMAFQDSAGVRRLALVPQLNSYSTLGSLHWQLVKLNAAGTQTILATSSSGITGNVLSKFDVFINYAVAGQVQVYSGGTKIIDYSGDVTTDSATALASVVLGEPLAEDSGNSIYGITSTYWSEVIAATTDTRAMSLATLPPAAAGNAFAWTGAATDISEITLDDTTQIISLTAGQIAETTVTSTSLAGTPGIVALVLNARAQKGGTGPQNVDLMVRTGGTDYASADIALPVSLSRISNVWSTNPATGSAWTASDLTAAGFNVGIKSVT